MEPFVDVKREQGYSIITFGTPKSNAMPGYILEKLALTIRNEGECSETNAILLQSAGDKAFCAGASFDELLEISDLEVSRTFFGGFAKVLQAMQHCGKIVVVRVQGKVTGGGVGIACAADYCLATAQADIALTEINLGIGPFVIGPYVERKVGTAEFTAMALDAEFRTAQWALEHHVYNKILPDIPALDEAVQAFMTSLAGRSSEAMQHIKKVSWEGAEHFGSLMAERIDMSAKLVLEDSAKENIARIKERLRQK